MNPIIKTSNINFKYKTEQILYNISFDLMPKEILVILGQSGSGKTTLLKNLIGIEKPQTGEILIDAYNITTIRRNQLNDYYKEIGVLFQSAALINSLTVQENIALPLIENTNLNTDIINTLIKIKLSWVGLNEIEHLYPFELSGGMKKRVALARALIMDPKILFFDEPHSGLDPITTFEINKLILKIRDLFKITIVVITHDITSAFFLSDKLLVLNKGKTEFFGYKHNFFKVKEKNEFLQKFVDLASVYKCLEDNGIGQNRVEEFAS